MGFEKAGRLLYSMSCCIPKGSNHQGPLRKDGMPSSIGAPQQHSQPSRKGKKAWRKNVDVSEIQQGLENAREEVIKGFVEC